MTTDAGRTPLKVIFIAGVGHSGSTVLDKVLGSVEGFTASGELRWLWQAGGCACGQPVEKCEYWQAVLERAFGNPPWVALGELVNLQYRHVRTRPRQLAAMSRAAQDGSRSESPIARYAELVDKLYAAIATETGARVIIDASKIPGDAYLLSLYSQAEIYVVHLLRDPRRVAYSWERSGQMSSLRSSAYWLWWNSLIEGLLAPRLGPRLIRVRYEDFCARPRETLATICNGVGEAAAGLPRFEGERTIDITPNHMVGGNISMLLEGPTRIEEPAASRTVPRRTRVLASLPVAPIASRYRYPLYPR